MKVDHIGYLAKDMERTVSEFLAIGYRVTKQLQDKSRKIDLVFMGNEEGNKTVVELIHPISPDSVIAKMLKKNGVAPYHICYSVPSLEDTIKELRQRRWVITISPAPAPAFEGRRVAFLYHSHGGLIEILEE